jgi:protein TonB
MRPWILAAGIALAACRGGEEGTVTLTAGKAGASATRDDPPVPVDPEPLVEYPEALFAQKISGTVLLRLFVTAEGRVVPESTQVQESSGWPALDSAARAAAPKLRYAPAIRNGVAVAGSFTQPVHFRHPGGAP